MNHQSLNSIGDHFRTYLQSAHTHLDAKVKSASNKEKIHVAGAGGVVTAAYEQLRIAAENAEEHVLLQRAIRRFYRRLFLTRDKTQLRASGEELAIELTLAGYLANDTLTQQTITTMSRLASEHYELYEQLLVQKKSHKIAESWTLEVLAVRIEYLINDPALNDAFVQFAHEYYISSPATSAIFESRPADMDTALFVAIHRALLKSDLASIRTALLARYQVVPTDGKKYISTNQQIDDLFESTTEEHLFRFIDRRGAPLRVFKRLAEDDVDLVSKLKNPDELLASFDTQIETEYRSITSRINRGIIKSVIFLIITKFLIGLAVEIPYDYWVHGGIIWLPLLINLFFPPVYMLLLRGTLTLPSRANTERLKQQMEEILYGAPKKQLERKSHQRSFGIGYNFVYALAFVVVFGGVGLWLHAAFSFELLHLFIFFLFLSGASFLGFRLSRLIREVEAVDSDQNAVTTIRDFLYMPFVVVGRYMSEKYAQLNIVALTLDMVIELPLKTILRLIRQWTAFISSKQDQL